MDEIKNDLEEVTKDRCMCEEDILNDILMSEKNISNNYSIAINEMSNKFLYKKILSIFTDTKDMARDIYNLMFSKGWYTITPETEDKISTSLDKYKGKKKELS
jgi:spore coat protein CotF